jgi:hypothetical protein
LAAWFGTVISLLTSQYPNYDTKVLEGVLDFTNHCAFIRTLSILSDYYDNHNTKYLHRKKSACVATFASEPDSTSLNQSLYSLFHISSFYGFVIEVFL